MQLLEVEKEQVKHCSLVKEGGHEIGKLASGEEEHSVFVYFSEANLETWPDLVLVNGPQGVMA